LSAAEHSRDQDRSCRQDRPHKIAKEIASMDCVEIRIPARFDSGELIAMLPEGECLGAWESDGFIHFFWTEALWEPAIRAEFERVLRSVDVDLAAEEIVVSRVEDRDWNLVWAKAVQPILIGKKILIRQSWNLGEIPPGGFELVIDPKRAFGTGFHATTQLLAEYLEDRIRGGERVLDLGTGSGILAMAAIRLGASRAVGIDNDPVAIECANENAQINGFGSELRLKVASVEDPDATHYDLVVANLDRRIILSFADVLSQRGSDGKKLLLSGLQVEDEEDIAAVFRGMNWKVIGRRQNGEWIALELETSDPSSS
jgi:ribosomal protein L11 methyltransferase